MNVRTACFFLTAFSVGLVQGEVFSYDCDSTPIEGGWNLVQQYCNPVTWVDGGLYYQQLDMSACPGGDEGAQDTYRLPLEDFVGDPLFFLEWRLETDGDQSEIIGGAPSAMALGQSFGIHYTFFVARDRAKLNRDNLLPLEFADFEAGVPHTHRLELANGAIDLFWWYVDGELAASGIAEGPFPSEDARITWQGRSWHLPNLTQWDYIRFGDIPTDGSGDFDSEGGVELRDWRYFVECVERTGITPDDPGCRWADMDFDSDVDMRDFGHFQRLFGN